MDSLTPEQRSERMSRIRGKDTKPEMIVRRLVHGLGYRYRLHVRSLPGVPDLVFPSRKKVIFVHGCFWHYHGDPSCPIAHIPKSRSTVWSDKFERNRTRDLRNISLLLSQGWNVLELWECQLIPMDRLETLILDFLGPRVS